MSFVSNLAHCRLTVSQADLYSSMENSPQHKPDLYSSMQNAEDVEAVAKANLDFGVKLYPHLVKAKGQEKNFVMSPFSVSSVLTMALEGAREETAKQMKVALGLKLNAKTTHRGYAEIVALLKPNEYFILEAVNKLFTQEGCPILDAYQDIVQSHYKAAVEPLNFSNEEASRKVINEFVEVHTRGKIRNLISKGGLSPLTRLVLVNAIYFKGNWAEPFGNRRTSKKAFQISPTEYVNVQMMQKTSYYATMTLKFPVEATILEIPYKGDRLIMYFVLSAKPEDFSTLEKTFPTIEFVKLERRQKIRWDIHIPKFRLETSHDLNKPLQELGMTDMYNIGVADFSGITGDKDLSVSTVLQKAFIEVNEQGTEAAAATYVGIKKGSCLHPPPLPQFNCNRPFLFVIKDNLTGMTLFYGRVVNPNKQ